MAGRKKFLLADMDLTMIGQECIDELAAEIGKRAQVAAITGTRDARRNRLRAGVA
jgi:phosphoserine phosphatase